MWDDFLGVSIKGVTDARVDAMTKVFDYDYKTCYEKTDALLRKIPNASVYRKEKDMIAIYVIDPNTTPVGVFFREIDPGHTQVEVSSESTPTKELVANSIFSGMVLKEAGKGGE